MTVDSCAILILLKRGKILTISQSKASIFSSISVQRNRILIIGVFSSININQTVFLTTHHGTKRNWCSNAKSSSLVHVGSKSKWLIRRKSMRLHCRNSLSQSISGERRHCHSAQIIANMLSINSNNAAYRFGYTINSERLRRICWIRFC